MIKPLHSELPRDCAECPYFTWNELNHDWYCDHPNKPNGATKSEDCWETFPDWCPLYTLPDGNKF